MSYAIEAIGVSKLYGREDEKVGLKDLTLRIPSGQVVAILGHNGAGKTTAIRGLATLLQFETGKAKVAGYDIATEPSKVRERISLVGQAAAVDEQLSAFQNLVLFGRLRGLDRHAAAERARELIQLFDLTGSQNRPVQGFSGGMRRRLDVAASMIVQPAVLFVDEPTTGLDPGARRSLWATLRELVAAGTTILLTTQYLEEADALADHIVLLAYGEVIAEGTSDQLKDRLGKSVIRLSFEDPGQAAQALDLLHALDLEPHLESAASLTLAATRQQSLLDCIRRLADHGISPTEVALRKPSLDEVFLSLTHDSTVTTEG